MPEQGDKTLLTQFLADRDVTCARCGYNLHGVASSACPECGDDLQLGLVYPGIAAYITTLVVISASFGGNALIGGVLLSLTIGFGEWWGHWTGNLLIFQLCSTAAALTVLLLMRRRFRWLRRTTQWVICVVTCVAVLAVSITFVVTFH